jgi:hypothetical protein
VRGFPKKMAGEDFYLLNKLAKVGAIHCLDGDPIVLSGRISNRVPFGTGRAMGQLLPAGLDHHPCGEPASRLPLETYRFPHPGAFAILGRWIDQLEEWIRDASAGAFARRSIHAIEGELRARVQNVGEPEIISWVESEDAVHSLAALLADATTEPRTARAVHGWFDAFRSMMFLHALRERGWPDLPHREALKQADFLAKGGDVSAPGRRDAGQGNFSGPGSGIDVTPFDSVPLARLTQLDRERGTGVLSRAAGGPVGCVAGSR